MLLAGDTPGGCVPDEEQPLIADKTQSLARPAVSQLPGAGHIEPRVVGLIAKVSVQAHTGIG
jgi:hypothetical protein